MDAISTAAIAAFVATIFGTGSSLVITWLTHRLDRDVIKFSKWHEKRLSAVEAIYLAFCNYLDFLRRALYSAHSGINMDPYFAFREELARQILYLDDPLAALVAQYEGELLLFWNSAMTQLSEQGESARESIRHDLDTRIPLYLPKIRAGIAQIVDPYRQRKSAALHGVWKVSP